MTNVHEFLSPLYKYTLETFFFNQCDLPDLRHTRTFDTWNLTSHAQQKDNIQERYGERETDGQREVYIEQILRVLKGSLTFDK